MTTAQEAGEAAAVATETAINENQERAAQAVAATAAAAQAEIDRANANAAEIAKAAMETHLGQQVSTLNERVQSWEPKITTLETTVAESRGMLGSILDKLNTLSNPPQSAAPQPPPPEPPPPAVPAVAAVPQTTLTHPEPPARPRKVRL